jgi:hypothetical protein
LIHDKVKNRKGSVNSGVEKNKIAIITRNRVEIENDDKE